MELQGRDPLRREPLRAGDYGLLALACMALFGFTAFAGKMLSGHQSVLPQNAREMLANHDWLIPRIGGQPWLERPPLPQWLVVGFAAMVGRCDSEWIVRVPAALVGTGIVLLAAWMASWWYGRTLALFAGLILATMWEFFSYGSNPEADIYLCLIINAAVIQFAFLEFQRRPALDEGLNPLGRRPWTVLLFFVLLGMTNLAKGLIFGTVMVGVPVALYLLWNFDCKAILRFTWLWGLAVFVVVSGAWPAVIYSLYPDITELWRSDYLERLSGNHVAEPRYYYLMAFPWVTMPWTVPALVGLGLTARKALGQRHSPERFLWCWAVGTPLVFSIPNGKHHHYLLHCLAPWAALAALGSAQLWRWACSWPGWLRAPVAWGVIVSAAADTALYLAWPRLGIPSWLLPIMLTLVPLWMLALCWAFLQKNGQVAAGSTVALWGLAFCGFYYLQMEYQDRYRVENRFLEEVRAALPAGHPFFVKFDNVHPLETYRLLFYSDKQATLLPNLSFLRDDRIVDTEAYILTRYHDLPELAKYGTPHVVLLSESMRGITSPQDRRVLVRLQFHENLERRAINVRLSPMQAVGREPTPVIQ